MELERHIDRLGAKNIKAISIDLCTENPIYTREDSRIVHIPKDIWNNFIERKVSLGNTDRPLYVGIRNSRNPNGKRFYFGRVEPSIKSENSTNKMALLPRWLFDYLETDPMDTLIDIVFVRKIEDAGKIVIKGSNSSYARTDIKTELESKMSSWNCINSGDNFKISDVNFDIVEIRTCEQEGFPEGKIVDFASIFNIDDVKVEFLEPDDIKEAREREEKRLKSIEEMKTRPLQRAKNHFGANVAGFNQGEEKQEENTFVPFQGKGNKISSSNPKLSREEIAQMRLKRLEEFGKQQNC